MQRKKVLLISTDYRYRNFSCRYLAAFLENNGLKVHILFISKRDLELLPHENVGFNAIAKWIFERDFQLIGMSLMTGGFKICEKLFTELSYARTNTKLVVGGIHAAVMPEECSRLPGINFVVQGPGEWALLDILHDKKSTDIPEIYCNQSQWRYIDFDNLPFPSYHFDKNWFFDGNRISPLEQTIYEQAQPWGGKCYYLTTALGCPYNCSYCSNRNRKIRRASVERVITELDVMRKQWKTIACVDIQDESFYLHDDPWIEKFYKEYQERIHLPLVVRMMPRFLSKKRLTNLRKAGLSLVKVGLQGSERINRELYDRPETNESFIKGMNTLNILGIGAEVDIILDCPWEKEDDLRGIALTLNRCPKPFWVHAYGLTLYPGTEIRKRAERDGIVERFATDPYDSEFVPNKLHGYRTPVAWRHLIQDICGWADKKLVLDILQKRGREFEQSVEDVWRQCPYKKKEEMLQKFLFP